jgi:PPOX class probable F420-dependent enzyme
MTTEEARRRFLTERVVRLATADGRGRPHLVPVVFAVATDGARDTLYSAVDHKPKRSTDLKRLRNVAENPRVALVADHYDDADWGALWWVRAEGRARVLEANGEEGGHAVDLLVGRYRHYRAQRPTGPVLAVDVERWSGWAASEYPTGLGS